MLFADVVQQINAPATTQVDPHQTVQRQQVSESDKEVQMQSLEGMIQRVKEPDLPLSEVDNKVWEQAWAAKQEEVHNAMQAFVPDFLALDATAEVKIRGSLSSGIKGNPAKVDTEWMIPSI